MNSYLPSGQRRSRRFVGDNYYLLAFCPFAVPGMPCFGNVGSVFVDAIARPPVCGAYVYRCLIEDPRVNDVFRIPQVLVDCLTVRDAAVAHRIPKGWAKFLW